MKKMWIAYFSTKEATVTAHIDGKIEGIDILVSGVGGQNPNQERPFIVFRDAEGLAVKEIQFFSENGATDVQQIL